MSTLLIALRALPEILKLLMMLGEYLKEKLGDNPAKFIADSHKVFEDLKNAKTPEAKQAAARALSDLLKRL